MTVTTLGWPGADAFDGRLSSKVPASRAQTSTIDAKISRPTGAGEPSESTRSVDVSSGWLSDRLGEFVAIAFLAAGDGIAAGHHTSHSSVADSPFTRAYFSLT